MRPNVFEHSDARPWSTLRTKSTRPGQLSNRTAKRHCRPKGPARTWLASFELLKQITDDQAFGEAIKNFLFELYLRSREPSE